MDMDLNIPTKTANQSMKGPLLENEHDQSLKSSNSSIYSSPNTTPTLATIPSVIHNEPSMSEQSHSTQLETDNPDQVDTKVPIYENLVKDTKERMTNKFRQLERDTGLTLNHNEILIHGNDPNSTESEANCQNHKAHNELKPMAGLKDLDRLRMEKELKRLKDELHLKNEIVDKMCKIRSQVECELEDLTASLFEEANRMVYAANVLRDRAEKDLVEANLKIDMLSAEVEALKELVITSTPSRPNPHLHPQLNSPKKKSAKKGDSHPKTHSSTLPAKSPSNYELGNSSKDVSLSKVDSSLDELKFFNDSSELGEIDPVYFEEFAEWRKSPTLEPINSNFMKRIYDEEIYPVFNFKNKDLTSSVLRSIESNSLTVESVASESFPKKCALLEVAKLCNYRMKVGDDRWFAICQLSRNRITAVCDLFCYLSYIKNGLVKSDPKHIYWQIMKRRHSIATAKLGFLPSTQ